MLCSDLNREKTKTQVWITDPRQIVATASLAVMRTCWNSRQVMGRPATRPRIKCAGLSVDNTKVSRDTKWSQYTFDFVVDVGTNTVTDWSPFQGKALTFQEWIIDPTINGTRAK